MGSPQPGDPAGPHQDPGPRSNPNVPRPPRPAPPPEYDDGPKTEETVLTHRTRSIDATLARFSAVHDELAEEEQEREKKRRKRLGKLISKLEPQDQYADLDSAVEKFDPSTKPRMSEADAQGSAPADPDRTEVHQDGLVDDADERPGETSGKDDDRDDTGSEERKPKAAAKAVVGKLVAFSGLRSPHSSRARVVGKGVALAAAVTTFLATGFGWGARGWVDNQFSHVSALDTESDAIADPDKQYGDENFLIVGSDSRYGATEEDNAGTVEDADGDRADTTMLAHIPADRERLVIVSFPRDLEVDRPECDRWNPETRDYTEELVGPATQVKLNAVYAVGGPRCMVKTIQNITTLKMTNFVGLDFGGFREMVDAVDGVDVCVEAPMIDQELGTILPEAGWQTITGSTALNFVRARKVQGDVTSDYGRMHRQQLFLSSLLRKVTSGDVLLDPSRLTDFVGTFARNTYGDNLSTDGLLSLAQSMQGLDTGRVTFVTLPTVGESNERGNEVMIQEAVDALFRAIIEDVPLPGEDVDEAEGEDAAENQAEGAGAGGPDLVDPTGIKIQVLNGSSISGAATTASTALAAAGFEIVTSTNAPEQVEGTLVLYSAEFHAQAATLAAMVPGAELREDPALGGAIQLVIGPNFTGVESAPPVSPSATGGAEGTSGSEEPQLPGNLDTVNAGQEICGIR